jgi:hypothetical protein
VALFGKWFRSGSKTSASAAPSPPADPAVVVAALIAEVRAHGVTGEPRVQGNYLFIDEAGVSRHVFLGNLVREYAEAVPLAQHELIARYARLAVRPVGLASPDLRARVLPKLTPRKERDELRAENAENLLAGRPLAGGALTLELAVDEPETVRVLTASDLAGCELTRMTRTLARSRICSSAVRVTGTSSSRGCSSLRGGTTSTARGSRCIR